ncbi:hypothetical protein [Rhodococcus artemisiae]|uniref:Uncharacterized protein n=1 Tax=Rhodococcus artemisiae TaxID=714159 RepID=A0ABU7LI37_9NOCA|nr:hypothetical protein [Rhodococcus artemisiae]MEE2061219.1 hypothetical protein [Rhodococcus artemisiae]
MNRLPVDNPLAAPRRTAAVSAGPLGWMLGRALARVMASRPLRPVMIEMMSGTDEYELPSYPADSAPNAR